MQKLQRRNISADAADAVRTMIVDGQLPEAERINEVRLAERLGVSRTPLREALSRLASEGAIVARPRLGYFVRPFTLDELKQLYAVRPILDPAALRLSGIPPSKRIDELERLNRKLSKTRDSLAAIALDDQWHLLLIADCQNHILIELIQNVILRSRRYELALFRETEGVIRASDDHARIIAALRKGDLDAACEGLKQNMESGVDPLVAWLTTRDAARAKGKKR